MAEGWYVYLVSICLLRIHIHSMLRDAVFVCPRPSKTLCHSCRLFCHGLWQNRLVCHCWRLWMGADLYM